jgi:hypothetical protein
LGARVAIAEQIGIEKAKELKSFGVSTPALLLLLRQSVTERL